MVFKLTLIGNILLLLLVVIIMIDKVYSHKFTMEAKLTIAYTEILLIICLVSLYLFSLFYKYIKKAK